MLGVSHFCPVFKDNVDRHIFSTTCKSNVQQVNGQATGEMSLSELIVCCAVAFFSCPWNTSHGSAAFLGNSK